MLATALFARIYVLTEPALLQVRWFVALRAAVLHWRDWAYAQIESHPLWRALRIDRPLARRLRRLARPRRPLAGAGARHAAGTHAALGLGRSPAPLPSRLDSSPCARACDEGPGVSGR